MNRSSALALSARPDGGSVALRIFNVVLVLTCCSRIVYPAAFRNLGFELGDTNGLTWSQPFLPPFPGSHELITVGEGPIDVLLPGWTAKLNGQDVGVVGFNSPLAPPPALSLVENSFYVTSLDVAGRYGLALHPYPFSSDTITLEQTGMVPEDTIYFTYRYVGQRLRLIVNGEVIPEIGTLPVEPGRTTAAYYDIQRFAGSEVSLSLTTVPILGQSSSITLDELAFVPEPGTWMLLLTGASVFWIGLSGSCRGRTFVDVRRGHSSSA